ncbi:MAG TPA: DUF5304 family protein [Yinghuangia sp.]|uniref:DUF5304 family protein n=1 Tax=Yinghuangia sp. YIM S10712 TaxID=3436930 RepID=UPI002C4DF22D|nr:DUF5304 family protein [Yinghuangia sp.]
MNPSRKTTDGSDDPWAGAVDPVSGPYADGGGGPGPGSPADEEKPHDDGDGENPADAPADSAPASPADRLAEEARRLAEVLAEQFDDVRHEVRDKVVEPLMRRHPDVAAHLGAAGTELLSAYRAFVSARERRWASRSAPAERVALDHDDEPDEADQPHEPHEPEGPAGSEGTGEAPGESADRRDDDSV